MAINASELKAEGIAVMGYGDYAIVVKTAFGGKRVLLTNDPATDLPLASQWGKVVAVVDEEGNDVM